jgi:hypothetical protein
MKSAGKTSLRGTAPAAAARQLNGFIAKFDAKHQALIRAVRRALRRRLPAANELVYDNYNFFVIGYGMTERPSDAVLSLVASANGVGICFIQGAKLPDPHRLLRGAGRQVRSIHLEAADELTQPAVEALIAAALVESGLPPAAARGKLVIRSVSAKQRPRRKR